MNMKGDLLSEHTKNAGGAKAKGPKNAKAAGSKTASGGKANTGERAGAKKVLDSRSVMTQLVLPRDSNSRWGLYGGKLMDWIDCLGSVVAMRHSDRRTVTAAIESLSFLSRINLGDIVIMDGWVNYVGRTSMEVEVSVEVEDLKTGERRRACDAFLTYVAIDDDGKPVEVPGLRLETAEEKRRWNEARSRAAVRAASKIHESARIRAEQEGEKRKKSKG